MESQELLYLQYLTPFHIAAWVGDYDFFQQMQTTYTSVCNKFLSQTDLLGNLPTHVAYFACDHWTKDIVSTILELLI